MIEAIDALGLANPGIGIRWPNDVEVDGRKLGGILPERVETDDGPRLLIGIGLNVFTRFDDAPPAVAAMATSLSALQPTPLGPSWHPRVLDAILTRFSLELSRLAAESPDLAAAWERLDLLRGQDVRIRLGEQLVAGRVRAIDAEGALCVDDGHEVRRLFAGQVMRDPA